MMFIVVGGVRRLVAFPVVFLMTVLSACALGFQSTPARGGPPASCALQSRFEELLAQGNDSKVSASSRERALEEAIKVCPQNPVAYDNLGVLLLQQHDFQGALVWIRQGLQAAPQDPGLTLELGIGLLSAGQPEQALSVLKSLPLSAKAQFYLGMTYRALGNHEAARQALAKSFELGNRDPYVLYAVIEQDKDLHDTKDGLQDFQTFYKDFPDSAWLHLLLGDAYRERQDNSNARAEYQKAASLDAKLPIVHYRLGLIDFDHDSYSAAVQDFREEIEISPSLGDAYLYLGVSLHRLGNDREALPYLEEAVARDPNLALAYRELAAVQIELKEPEAARKTLQEAERRFPKEQAFPAQLSRLMRTMGDSQDAGRQAVLANSLSRENNPIVRLASPLDGEASPGRSLESAQFRDLSECIKRANIQCASEALSRLDDESLQKNPEYLNLKSQALNMTHEGKQALAAIQRAIEIDPNQANYFTTQGRVYQRLGNQTDAIKSFLHAEQLQPNSAEPIYYVGMSFFLMGDYFNENEYYDRAAHNFRAALDLDPRFDKAEFMLGTINAVEFKLDQAKQNFEKALKMSPNNPYYRLYYGVLLSRLGDQEGALREMRSAEKLDPSDARTCFNLGGLLAQRGSFEAAKEQLEAGVRLDPRFAPAYYTLGRVYYRLGLKAKSQEALHKFQQMMAQAREEDSDPVGSSIERGESSSASKRP